MVVGFVSAVHYIHPDKIAPEVWINEVGVAPSHRGQSIAKRMLATLLEVARELGCSEAWVLTDDENAAAMRLYESAGGVVESKKSRMFTFFLDGTANR